MQDTQSERAEGPEDIEAVGHQLGLEFLVFCGIGALLFLIGSRIPAVRADATVVLWIALVLHAAGLFRLVRRTADHLERDPAD
jgi:hypothetical protein